MGKREERAVLRRTDMMLQLATVAVLVMNPEGTVAMINGMQNRVTRRLKDVRELQRDVARWEDEGGAWLT